MECPETFKECQDLFEQELTILTAGWYLSAATTAFTDEQIETAEFVRIANEIADFLCA